MSKSKAFIDKSNASHFQIVHRSQRDPKIADDSSSKLVLKPLAPSKNLIRKGKHSLIDIHIPEEQFDSGNYDIPIFNQDDPTLHGIYIDENDDYDYMQHLKQIDGDSGSIFIENKPKKVVFELPNDIFASQIEDDVGMLNRGSGINNALDLDMDPNIRQVLESLEDDAFVEDDSKGDFFDGIVQVLKDDVLPEDYKPEFDDDFCDPNDEEWVTAFKK